MLSLTRGRVCQLQLPLALARSVILGFESRGTGDHILLSQIRDFPFRHLLRLAGLCSRYLTLPPHRREILMHTSSIQGESGPLRQTLRSNRSHSEDIFLSSNSCSLTHRCELCDTEEKTGCLGVVHPCLKRILQIHVHNQHTSNLFMFMFTMSNSGVLTLRHPKPTCQRRSDPVSRRR
jgi:hypothetical protein